jgi:hypothetical protein
MAGNVIDYSNCTLCRNMLNNQFTLTDNQVIIRDITSIQLLYVLQIGINRLNYVRVKQPCTVSAACSK